MSTTQATNDEPTRLRSEAATMNHDSTGTPIGVATYLSDRLLQAAGVDTESASAVRVAVDPTTGDVSLVSE